MVPELLALPSSHARRLPAGAVRTSGCLAERVEIVLIGNILAGRGARRPMLEPTMLRQSAQEAKVSPARIAGRLGKHLQVGVVTTKDLHGLLPFFYAHLALSGWRRPRGGHRHRRPASSLCPL